MAECNSDEVVHLYIHGDLDLKIIKARCESIIGPYVKVCLGRTDMARTRIFSYKSECPEWNEHFQISLAHPISNLKICFHLENKDKWIGSTSFSVQRILTGETISEWFPIFGYHGNPPKCDTAILIEMRFTNCEDTPLYRYGIASNPDTFGVGNCQFAVRKGGSVTLYQDAHVPDSMLPEIKLEGEKVFEHEKCWEDICHAILEAKELVYIIGWSIHHKVKLVREPTRPLPELGNMNLGDLLKYKSGKEGVRVLILVWNDPFRLMKTHNKDTEKFFKNSSVKCVRFGRITDTDHSTPEYEAIKEAIGLGLLPNFFSGIHFTVNALVFAHHQKCVIVDTQGSGNNRKITTFIGGLDLCDGRYDTPEHRLFRDRETVYQNDDFNPTLLEGFKGPRQPWHDLCCKIEGPAAYDVLTNFEQLWSKAEKWSGLKKGCKFVFRAVMNLDTSKSSSQSIPNDDPKFWVSKEDDPENWHVQIFRSFESSDFRKTNLVVEKSIQSAYIQAIRSAQHFIYVENQYFLGSSYAWPSNENAGANNLIPMELALKIASKIRAKERFAVYIVKAMQPEGNNFLVTEKILFWQFRTMQMMYGIIAKELKSMHLENSHPQDYLNFYCLGNREERSPSNQSFMKGVLASESHQVQRFMVYVHGKGMIVDDEYMILGSANINERSLAGSRDTEIAMGACQPHHTWGRKKGHPHGQIYGFRMLLWAEHLGILDIDDCFKEPKDLACIKSVNKIAEDNWRKYTAKDFTPLQGHLLKYPIQVDTNGEVGCLPEQGTFPDGTVAVLGSENLFPALITT